jgi:Ser/Thr protein kinase RdoA (MazF antagonist)
MRDATGLEGRLSVLSFGGLRQEMFRLDSDVDPPIFLKQIPPGRQATAERAEAIGRWLADQGVNAGAALAGFPKRLAAGGVVVAMPYFEGRRLRATPEDCRALGKSVAELHAALARHPDREQWRAFTELRLGELTAIRHRCASGGLSVGPDADLLLRLASDRTLDFTCEGLPRRPLHGDLNPGNVLVVGETPLLLDFEDVFHSYLPAQFELALMVERFVLVRVDDDDDAVDLGRNLVGRYRTEIGATLAPMTTDPAEIFRALALRSLCVLALAASNGLVVSDGEWKKFFRLERQAAQRAHVIRAIFQEWGS